MTSPTSNRPAGRQASASSPRGEAAGLPSQGRRQGRRGFDRPYGPQGGFTLIELVTVMTIMAILVALTVGAVQGIRTHVARQATNQILAALDTALQAYYDDWGRYPYDATATEGPVGAQVDYDVVDTVYRLAAVGDTPEVKREAILYAALTMRRRNGPYLRTGTTPVMERQVSSGKGYYLIVDGWKRPIRYLGPADATAIARTPSGVTLVLPSNSTAPVLESLGPQEFDDSDNLTNYGYLNSP